VRVYLDHNATTPLREEVVDAMLPALRDVYGNPSSTHEEGVLARRIVEQARQQVSSLTGCAPGDVMFTAGATEANNALVQALRTGSVPWQRMITTTVEHPSVGEPVTQAAAVGHEVTTVGVDAAGRIDLVALEAALVGPPALVSVLWANNETGVLQPAEAIAERVRAAGSFLHLDATQALGKTPVDVSGLGAHWISCSAHKLNGPKGVGALIAADAPEVPALLIGGPQERRQRGGTENVASIAGLGAACALAGEELPERMARYGALRDQLWHGLEAQLDGVRWNGGEGTVLVNTLSVEFEGAASDVLLQALDIEGVAASAGAACHSGSVSPSHVLVAMGRTAEQARGTLRLSVGHGNDEEQIDWAIDRLVELVPRARQAARA
jgi:cysteine desulfurase